MSLECHEGVEGEELMPGLVAFHAQRSKPHTRLDPITGEMQACKHRKTIPKQTVELENKIQPSTREHNYVTWMDAYLCDVWLSLSTLAYGSVLRVQLLIMTEAEVRLGC